MAWLARRWESGACGAGRARLAEDHALADQALEGLRRGHNAQVEQHLVPEARVQQVEHRVLRAACARRQAKG